MSNEPDRKLGLAGIAGAALLTAVLGPLLAFGAVPQRINFQGRLVDPATKNPITDPSAGVTFRICAADSDCTSSPNKMWEEQQTLDLNNGVFEAVLGNSVPISSAVFAGGQRWLEIKVENDVLSPRQPLVSAPSALRAAAAEYLEPGSTNYVQVGNSLQSGSSFYVSSATVAGNFIVGGAVRVLGAQVLDGGLTVGGVLTAGSGTNQLTGATGLIDASKLDPDPAKLVPSAAVDPSSVAKLSAAGLVPDTLLNTSSVTKRGNSFNAPELLLQLGSNGLIPNALVDASSVAKLSPSGYIQNYHLDSASITKLSPSGYVQNYQLDPASVTKLSPAGYIHNYQLDPASVTKSGNVYNAANGLVRLDASAALSAPGSGSAVYSITTSSSVNVTGTGAKVREAGSDLVPKGAIILWVNSNACPPGYTEYTALRGRLPVGLPAGGTLAGTAGTALTDLQTKTHTHTGGAGGGTIRIAAGNNLTNAADTTMPYLQLLFCQKS